MATSSKSIQKQKTEMKIFTLLIALMAVSADLIGWNRMSNNLKAISQNREKVEDLKKNQKRQKGVKNMKRFIFERQTGMKLEDYKKFLLNNHRLRIKFV